MLAVFIGEDFPVMLQNRDDQLHGLHRHIVLLIQRHRDDPVLKFTRKKLEFRFQFLRGVQRLQRLQTLKSDFSDFVMQGPACEVEASKKKLLILCFLFYYI